MTIDTMYEYGFVVGDRVQHYTELTAFGTIKHIDDNLPDITTVLVEWDDDVGEYDIQWSNKLIRVTE